MIIFAVVRDMSVTMNPLEMSLWQHRVVRSISRMRMKNFDHYGYKRKQGRWKRWFLGLIALGVIGSLAILLGTFRTSSVASNVEQPLSEAEMVALIPKGRELALAGDCFGCHSRPN